MIYFFAACGRQTLRGFFDALSIPPGVLFLLAKERGIGFHE